MKVNTISFVIAVKTFNPRAAAVFFEDQNFKLQNAHPTEGCSGAGENNHDESPKIAAKKGIVPDKSSGYSKMGCKSI